MSFPVLVFYMTRIFHFGQQIHITQSADASARTILTQYTLAMDRCQADLAAQADGLHPAVLRLIQGRNGWRGPKHGKWVGVCGALWRRPGRRALARGPCVTELSVDPVSVPGIKALVRKLDYPLCVSAPRTPWRSNRHRQ